MKLSNAFPVRSAQALEHLPPRIQSLITSLRKNIDSSPTQIQQCLIAADIQLEDLLPWEHFEHPVAHSYGRKPVYVNNNFEIMVMSWAPGDFSAIHDHGTAEWGAVQSFGEAEHSIYQLENKVLKTIAIDPFSAGTVHAVEPVLIHQMGNPGRERFLSLHVYGQRSAAESITGDARLFDLLEGCAQFTDGGVFFCLPEEQISGRQWGIRGDRNTTLRHHQQMRDRIMRVFSYTNQDSHGNWSVDEMTAKLQRHLSQLNAEISMLQSL